MNETTDNEDIISNINLSSWLSTQQTDSSSRLIVRSQHQKSLAFIQKIEICFLILIFIEHTIVFILTFRTKSLKTNRTKQNQRSIILPTKSFLYSCLHRNWIRAFSFSNICLSVVYFLLLLLKYVHPTSVQHSSITYYSLPLNLIQQMLINFSSFHLFIISVSVFQYFLRYFHLLQNTYAIRFFNGRNLLLTKHTNIALILSGSLALIFAYNFIFYTPKYPHTITLLPLITFNMILLPLINLIIFLFILISFTISFLYKSNPRNFSFDNEQESLRSIIEKKTCIKCYSKILQKNPNLYQDHDYSYRNLHQHFFSPRVRSSYSFPNKRISLLNTKKKYSRTDFFSQQQKTSETNSANDLFLKTTSIQLNHQHSLCHLSYHLLLLFLLKYILFTFPQYTIQMVFHLKQFYHFIIKHNSSNNLTNLLYEDHKSMLTICHYFFLLSRFGDSFLLTRLPDLIKKYFPCWCHFNSTLLRKQQISHQILTTKTSESSNNEVISTLDISNLNDLPNELKQQEIIQKPNWKIKRRHFRLRFRFVPLWSNNRPRLFKENV